MEVRHLMAPCNCHKTPCFEEVLQFKFKYLDALRVADSKPK
jgi:hypothetical protein